jgi:hypothetical protein
MQDVAVILDVPCRWEDVDGQDTRSASASEDKARISHESEWSGPTGSVDVVINLT